MQQRILIENGRNPWNWVERLIEVRANWFRNCSIEENREYTEFVYSTSTVDIVEILVLLLDYIEPNSSVH